MGWFDNGDDEDLIEDDEFLEAFERVVCSIMIGCLVVVAVAKIATWLLG